MLRNPHAAIQFPRLCLICIPVNTDAARQGREGQGVAPGVIAYAAADRRCWGEPAPGDCSLCDAATAGNARGSCVDSAGRGEPRAARNMRWWPKKRRLPPEGRGGLPRVLPAVVACEEDEENTQPRGPPQPCHDGAPVNGSWHPPSTHTCPQAKLTQQEDCCQHRQAASVIECQCRGHSQEQSGLINVHSWGLSACWHRGAGGGSPVAWRRVWQAQGTQVPSPCPEECLEVASRLQGCQVCWGQPAVELQGPAAAQLETAGLQAALPSLLKRREGPRACFASPALERRHVNLKRATGDSCIALSWRQCVEVVDTGIVRCCQRYVVQSSFGTQDANAEYLAVPAAPPGDWCCDARRSGGRA